MGFSVGKYQSSPLFSAFNSAMQLKDTDEQLRLREKAIDDASASWKATNKLSRDKFDYQTGYDQKTQFDPLDAQAGLAQYLDTEGGYDMGVFETLGDDGLFIKDETGRTIINPAAETIMGDMGTSNIHAQSRGRARDYLKKAYPELATNNPAAIENAINQHWGTMVDDQTTAFHDDMSQYLLSAFEKERGEFSDDTKGVQELERLLGTNQSFFNLMNRGLGENNLFKLMDKPIKLTPGSGDAYDKYLKSEIPAVDNANPVASNVQPKQAIDYDAARAAGWQFDRQGNVIDVPWQMDFGQQAIEYDIDGRPMVPSVFGFSDNYIPTVKQ